MYDYKELWNTCKINDYTIVDACINKILKNKKEYVAVEQATRVPWWFVGILHLMESNCDFKSHLHNGDPLTDRTTHVPSGRPVNGKPPFVWSDSAIDAMRYKGYDRKTFNTIDDVLTYFEGYNGFGYRRWGVNSPYLWSGSNQYTKGKYTADGRFDKNAVSQQIGSAVILKEMIVRNIVGGL